jgi:Tfp pilus assembly PilM family ATPase
MEKGLTKQLVFCGGPTEAFQQVQDQLLEYGVYPDRLELSSATTLGGVCDYARLNKIESPILCFELTSKSANIFILNRGQVEVARPVPFGLDSIYPLLQRELGLKDEASARKLFFSNTFDFAEMGPKSLQRMIKELQASTGFYEVQTGQTIDRVFMSVLPKNLSWIAKTVSDSLGLEIMQPNIEPWLDSLDVKLADSVEVSNLGSRWLGLFSLMGEFHLREEVNGE